jgi:hypothetical protein
MTSAIKLVPHDPRTVDVAAAEQIHAAGDDAPVRDDRIRPRRSGVV